MAIQKLMSHFWDGLKTGKFIPKTDEEIRKIINENHFGGEAIIELSDEDRIVIENEIFNHLKYRISKNLDLRKLCEQEVVYAPNDIRCGGFPCFITPDSTFDKAKEYFKKEKLKGNLLTKNEKIELFSNPDIWLNGRLYSGNSNSPMGSWGMRHLEAYGFQVNEFGGVIKRVKGNTGKNLLNVLDIGGAMGVALKDIKDFFPKDVITNNMTVDVEPVTYEFDNLYLCPGERFPKSLEENMDIILSNMAFTYMSGQNLALENCLRSLSVGGEALLSVGIGKQDSFVQDFSNRMRNQYDRMIDLENKGFIELKVKSGTWVGHALTYKPESESNNWFPPAWVEIRKLKSLK
ncbi:MAG: class I SAM-dependent methyltransferase [Nanoarchaeota archaeon]|nr:class I SAM-dependent methyltransferase [Nanoarchaeota archaeon]